MLLGSGLRDLSTWHGNKHSSGYKKAAATMAAAVSSPFVKTVSSQMVKTR
jgi:hypothetical protein